MLSGRQGSRLIGKFGAFFKIYSNSELSAF
jgi:hypothetical protein